MERITGRENHGEQPVFYRSNAPIGGEVELWSQGASDRTRSAVWERETRGLLRTRLQAHGFRYWDLILGNLNLESYPSNFLENPEAELNRELVENT